MYIIICRLPAYAMHNPFLFVYTVKSVLSGHSKRHQKLVFKTDYLLMFVKSIAECSNGSILQYFRPSLSYHLLLRPLFCLFLSGRLRQVFTVSLQGNPSEYKGFKSQFNIYV